MNKIRKQIQEEVFECIASGYIGDFRKVWELRTILEELHKKNLILSDKEMDKKWKN